MHVDIYDVVTFSYISSGHIDKRDPPVLVLKFHFDTLVSQYMIEVISYHIYILVSLLVGVTVNLILLLLSFLQMEMKLIRFSFLYFLHKKKKEKEKNVQVQ